MDGVNARIHAKLAEYYLALTQQRPPDLAPLTVR